MDDTEIGPFQGLEAAFQAAQTGDRAPPITKAPPPAIQEPPTVPISVDDTPMEPATSPRRVDPQIQEWPVELQLATRKYGPRPEPEVYPCRYVMNDGQWTEAEHAAHLHKAAQATHDYAWNREARAEAERHNREFAQSMADWRTRVEGAGFKTHPAVPHGPPTKSVSFMRGLPEVHDALRLHDPSKVPASQPILSKKAPPTTGRGRPAGFYSDTEPPRIGSEQVQPAPPPKLPRSTPTTPAHPPRPPLSALPQLSSDSTNPATLNHPILAQWDPFGPSPRLLSPSLDFPKVILRVARCSNLFSQK